MAKKTAGKIEEIGGRIEQFAGADVRENMMKGSEKAAASSDPKKVALWVKGAMDRLDTLTDFAKHYLLLLLLKNIIYH